MGNCGRVAGVESGLSWDLVFCVGWILLRVLADLLGL